MESIGSGDNVAQGTAASHPEPSTGEASRPSKKQTRSASKSTSVASKAEALELLTSALEHCRKAGFEVRMGEVTGYRVGIGIFPASLVVVDGVTHMVEAL